ncbi:proline racemase family protein [Virgibacillus siamensis]|uniref:proline racemase family protein n=1 Tax=Virgibacillus siamensis TaxID=480071 RepID=UPI00158F0B22|nr:proline racemase family protein [Virgibacillus siamensis]
MEVEKMFSSIDTHVAGEPFRIIVHSPMTLDADVMALNQETINAKFQREKELLLNEPRGYQGMNGCIVLPSKTADYACLFVHHDNDTTFTYSGLAATVTALLETGNIAKKETNVYHIETVHGTYAINATFEQHEVTMTRFECGESQILDINETCKTVQIDQSRNYLIYHLPESIPGITIKNLSAIIKWGNKTVTEMRERQAFNGIILTEPINHAAEVRSVTFKKDGTILRSPGADSTFAIFRSLLHESPAITTLTNQSIFESTLTASLAAETTDRFLMETKAFVTGIHQFIYDQTDPLEHGFLLK